MKERNTNNERSVTLREDRVQISVFKSDLVDLKGRGISNLVTTVEETLCGAPAAAPLPHWRVELPVNAAVLMRDHLT